MKAPDHELQQVLPIVKDHILHERLDILEERLALASTRRSKAYLSSLHSKTVWNRKANRLRLSRNAARYFFTVTKVVLQMVALRLQPVVVFSLRFRVST